jgi:hypothetical protein
MSLLLIVFPSIPDCESCCESLGMAAGGGVIECMGSEYNMAPGKREIPLDMAPTNEKCHKRRMQELWWCQ